MRRHGPYITAVDPAHALWIGGPQGSGKSSIARALADRFGLQLYVVDEMRECLLARGPMEGTSDGARARDNAVARAC
jgi:predicted kinase